MCGKMSHVVRLKPRGWKEKHVESSNTEEILPEVQECSVLEKQIQSAWARLKKMSLRGGSVPLSGARYRLVGVLW